MKPIAAQAVATELLAMACCYIIASVALSCAISVAVENPNTMSVLQNCFDSLSEACKTQVENYARAASVAYLFFYDWQSEQYRQLCTEVTNYFKSQQQTSSGRVFGSIYCNDDGILGFTEETSFQIYFPSGTSSAIYILPGGTLTLMNGVKRSDLPSHSLFDQFNCRDQAQAYIARSSEGLDYIYCYSYGKYPEATTSSFFQRENLANYQYYYVLGFPILKFDQVQSDSTYARDTIMVFFDGDGNIYDYGHDANGYFFRNCDTGAAYQNLYFPDMQSIVDWFRAACGFYTLTYGEAGIYSPPQSLEDLISFDLDEVDAALQAITDIAAENDTITAAVPGSLAQLKVLADNPAAVLDPSIAATLDVPVYPAELPMVDTSPTLWQTKFPFCLPWDLYNLFAGFFIESECPKFELMLLPKNSFGLTNEDVTIEIDFSKYGLDHVAKIIRFFMSVSFVFGLILLTRKITGSGGG